MPDSPGEGGQFAADLYELFEVAQKDLRPLAELYSGFSSSVDGSNSYDLDPAPAGGTVFGGQGALRSGSALTALRDDVQYAFALSSQHIESAAATLIEVAESYAGTDDETRSDFDAFVSENYPDGAESTPAASPTYPASGGGPVPRD
ncbi:hypothetical protein [Glycomyces terrestris]|uniref:Uncharacterized protein n=1 Tax=Glycomyces terrestris TaxID=2493553 RepID=A0A426UXS5_9ACTN|nr:hypothetical protein [Glycomyces terrestris]RRR99371.1 hypothetical protein EIW28_11695 [Glycomyces terrestris]